MKKNQEQYLRVSWVVLSLSVVWRIRTRQVVVLSPHSHWRRWSCTSCSYLANIGPTRTTTAPPPRFMSHLSQYISISWEIKCHITNNIEGVLLKNSMKYNVIYIYHVTNMYQMVTSSEPTVATISHFGMRYEFSLKVTNKHTNMWLPRVGQHGQTWG